jgi:hypothetical protein
MMRDLTAIFHSKILPFCILWPFPIEEIKRFQIVPVMLGKIQPRKPPEMARFQN